MAWEGVGNFGTVLLVLGVTGGRKQIGFALKGRVMGAS